MLGIEVEHQNTAVLLTQRSGKIDTGGRLGAAAFLIGNGDGPHGGHWHLWIKGERFIRLRL
jgi:hypothetical protein